MNAFAWLSSLTIILEMLLANFITLRVPKQTQSNTISSGLTITYRIDILISLNLMRKNVKIDKRIIS